MSSILRPTYAIEAEEFSGAKHLEMVDVQIDGFSTFRTNLRDLGCTEFPRFLTVQREPEGPEIKLRIRELNYDDAGLPSFALYRPADLSNYQVTVTV